MLRITAALAAVLLLSACGLFGKKEAAAEPAAEPASVEQPADDGAVGEEEAE